MTDLRFVPGIGAKKEAELVELSYDSLEKLKGADPDEIYFQLSVKQGNPPDKCVLYAIRCAVAYANDPAPNPDNYRWWFFCDTKDDKNNTRNGGKTK